MKNLLIISISIVSLVSCTQSVNLESLLNLKTSVLYNQVGYGTDANKMALLKVEASSFSLVDETGKIVFESELSSPKVWPLSGDTVCQADFSSYSQPGAYYLVFDNKMKSPLIHIGAKPYSSLAAATLKSYYFNRSSQELETKFAQDWARQAGHNDTKVIIHESAADHSHKAGDMISSPGGWYDAGDYNKYIVNSAITTYTLMLSYDINSEYHNKLDLNIPESKNTTPDILDEVLYNLNWMLTMQDTNDGGVYHKLTTKEFEDFIMPHEAEQSRYLMMKTTSATLDFISAMSYASRIYGQFEEFEAKSEEFKQSAELAWEWAIKHPATSYEQPADVCTGEYNDTSLVDEWFWAAAELYLTSGKSDCLGIITTNYSVPSTPKWDAVHTLGIISLVRSSQCNKFSDMKKDFLSLSDSLVNMSQRAPYHVSLSEFAWGSNSDVANEALLKIVAHQLQPEADYIISAQDDLDYLLGRNATGYCFVTGFGDKSPLSIHHRPSIADTVEAPVPGFLVGGPNTIVLNDCGDPSLRSIYPAKSYIDMECSYSTNEIAINWNAPFVLLTSFTDAYDYN